MICYIMFIIQAQTILLERGVWGPPPQKKFFFIRISTKILQFKTILEGTLVCYYVTLRVDMVETAHFETDWYIETHNIHKYL